MRALNSLAIAAGLALAAPVAAADDVVTAYNPTGLAKAMKDAGYTAELSTDDYGDPMIKTEFGDYGGAIYFYGCDDKTHDRCDSVQMRAGLDRKSPMPLSLLNTIVKKYRYAAIWLDDEGDPWINFDVFTGAGIPKSVFMMALDAYRDNIATVADMVFEEERKK